MARLMMGIASSHGPMLGTPPEQWGGRAEADRANDALVYRGKEYTYQELRELRAAAFADDCAIEVWRERHAACRTAIDRLGEIVHEAGLDVLVIISDDQMETFSEELLAQFAVYWGNSVPHVPPTQAQLDAMPVGLAVGEAKNFPPEGTVRECHGDLALHIIRATSAAGFDPAASNRLPAGVFNDHGIPHGWGFVIQQMLGGTDVPAIVPVFINTFYEPNPPSAKRCYEFGQALGAAIRSYPEDLKVGLVASGGLSHFVVDADLDHEVLDALQAKDAGFLTGLTDDVLRSGTSELRNWVSVAGAMADSPLAAEVIDYQPCYRTEAGTGCGMGFVAWRQNGAAHGSAD